MTETTTIEIPVSLRDELQAAKKRDREPYYAVIERWQEDTDETVTLEASEKVEIAEVVAEALQR
jgi:hypothetical protein